MECIGAVLNAVQGHAAPETGHAYARARELWEQLGSPSEFLHVPFGQSRYHAYRGELDLAVRLDQDLLRLSRQREDSAGLVLGHYSSGRNLMHAGRFASSRSHLEEVLALYDPNSHHSLVRQTGTHPQLVAQAHLAIVLFCLGFPDQALAQSRAAIAEAQRLAHPRSLAATLAIGSRLLVLVGDNMQPWTIGQTSSLAWRPSRVSRWVRRDCLSRVGQGQKWRFDGRNVSSSQPAAADRATGASCGCPIF